LETLAFLGFDSPRLHQNLPVKTRYFRPLYGVFFLSPNCLETFAKRPLSPPAEAGRCIRILILEIFNIFLWLIPLKRDSYALILNEIERFSKVSSHGIQVLYGFVRFEGDEL